MTLTQRLQRRAFEAWISAPPVEAPLARLPAAASWPGQYADYRTQLAWEAWQAACGWVEARHGDEPAAR